MGSWSVSAESYIYIRVRRRLGLPSGREFGATTIYKIYKKKVLPETTTTKVGEYGEEKEALDGVSAHVRARAWGGPVRLDVVSFCVFMCMRRVV